MSFLKGLAVVMVGLVVTTSFAQAEEFSKKHPRRAEVNRRARNEERRINKDEKNGSITKGQAQELKGEEKGIKAQEHAEVKANGGYLTKGEQGQLNKEENGLNKDISNDKKMDQAPTPKQ